MRRAGMAGLAVGLLWAGLLPAFADAPPQAAALCSGAPRGCAVRVADAAREGATLPVTVQGTPQTRVRVVGYQAIADGPELRELRPLGDGVELLTNRSGVAHVDLTIPAVVEDPSSGWLLVSVEGIEADVSLTVGAFVPFGARIPTVLGDGYAERKPVGVQLDLAVAGAIPGTRFAVELEQDDGSWTDVTVGDGYVRGAPDEVATVSYMLPRGLTATPKRVRLRNVSDSAPAGLWYAEPSIDGVPAPFAEPFVPPPVGDALDGTAVADAHPVDTVRAVAGGIAVASVGFVTVALAVDGARRGRGRGETHG